MIFNTFHFHLEKRFFIILSNQPTNKQHSHRDPNTPLFFLRLRQQKQQISPHSYTTQPNRKIINHHQIHREREGETELKWRHLTLIKSL